MSKTLLSIITFLFPVIAWSVPITFDLRTLITDDNDGVPSLSLTQASLTATLSANTGVINRTSSAVGINSRCSTDNTDELDLLCDGTPPERITVGFDQTVIFIGFNVSLFSSGDSGLFSTSVNDFSVAINRRGDFFPTVAGVPLTIAAGQTFYIEASSNSTNVPGNGFSFNRFTVETIARNTDVVAVPEPPIALLMLAACFSLIYFRKKTFVGDY